MYITTTDILDAINLLLVQKWPERTVYVEACPVDFDRPAFWLRVLSHEQSDAGRFIQRHKALLQLTQYDALDDHYDASWARLSRETDEAMYLLSPTLEVGERRLRLALNRLPRDPDQAHIQIGAEWMSEMPGADKQTAPVADSYELNVRGVFK